MITHEALLFVEEAAIEEELLAQARHDLRNRLAVIRGSAFYLRRRMEATELWGTDPRVQQFFAQLESEVDTANGILADRVTVTRPVTRKVQPVDLAECARLAVERARIADPSAATVVMDVAPALVSAEPIELTLAVRCLVENATEATRGGGAARVLTTVDGRRAAIEVRDEGEGFGPGGVDEAMEPFFSTRKEHRGLGLNIAQRISRRYGGTLEVRALERGASARLSFPLLGGAPVDAAPGR